MLGVACCCYLLVFLARAGTFVDVEAADSLLAAPIALVAVSFGLVGGVIAGLLAVAVFAGGEVTDTADLTWDEIAVRAVGFTALGAFVGSAATLLERTRARFTGAFDDAPSGILLTDARGRISAANAAAGRLLRYDPSDLIGRQLSTLSRPDDVPADEAQWQSLQAGRTRRFVVEHELVARDGGTVPVMMAVARMASRSQQRATIVHLVDMTAQRRSEERLAYLADHDPLTGLFNRRRFDQELRRHLVRVARHGPAGAVVLLDLDHFKFVNDTLGHGAGDVVLRAVSEALATRARAEDVLARLGGDEFALLMPDVTNQDDVRAAAADILAVISSLSVALPPGLPQPVEDVRVTASLGAVLIPPLGNAGRLLAAADVAMYEAKEAGRGQARIHTSDSPHAEQVRAGFTWGERIRRSLDESKFELWLQPIVSFSGGHERHYEALLRLNDGEQVWLPSQFLRHAERLGFMVEIDRYVIERAIAMLAELSPEERPTLEVNLSAASLGDHQLASWIATRLDRHDVAARFLIFEVTETVAIENLTLAASTIDKLRHHGCGFALDDFGVGVSSFYYLRELPFDILKIDGAFVRDLPSRHENQVIVRAMIDTAHGLGKTIIAEFVETDEQAEILRRLRCDRGQGHLFGAAQPPGLVLDVPLPAAPGGS